MAYLHTSIDLKTSLEQKPFIWIEVVSIAKSGMSRRFRIFLDKLKQIEITEEVAELLKYSYRNGSMLVSGCGMNMGWYVGYCLGEMLLGNGDKIQYDIFERD